MLTVAPVLLVLALQTPAPAPPKPTTPEELRAHLDSLAEKHFRGVVYVEQAGRELFYHAVGMADPDSKRPFTKDTGLCIGSIVKPMVRVALCRLADQGKLKLSDPISKYFEGVPEDKAGITLQHLADHTSGFQDVFGGDYEPMERDELMKQMLASKLLFKPGDKDEYSNSGFSMLSTILEKVSGKSIEDLIAEIEFAPIGLKRTGYVRPKWKAEECAVGYGPLGRRWGSPLDRFWYPDGPSWNLRGNGGMISTVTDLARWARAVHDLEILSKENHQLLNPAFYREDGARRISLSAGGNGIFNTVVAYNPGKKMVVVAASVDGRFEIEQDRGLWRMIHSMLPAL